MQMTNQEIVRSFKGAKHRGEQIKVLADLNCTTKEEIIRILNAEGLEVNGRVFNGGNQRSTSHNSGTVKKASFSSSTSSKAPEKVEPKKDIKAFEVPKEEEAEAPKEAPKEEQKPEVPQSVIDALFSEAARLKATIADLQARYEEITNYIEVIS